MSRFLQLAPMQAMTDIFFMNTYHKIFGGFNEMMAPYILASSKSPIKHGKLKKNFSQIDKNITLVPQLLSNEPEGFLHYANLFYDMGFNKVNLNLGCPFPFVTKKIRGAGLLPYPEKIEHIIKNILFGLKPDLSVKIRLGLYDKNEILPIINILNKYNIKEVIVHPRTAVQKYDGKTDTDFFNEIYPQFTVPVIYNGDIVSKSDIDKLSKQHSHIKGYMIGRGAFINPFVTGEIHGKFIHESEKKIKYRQLYYALYEHYKSKTLNNKGLLNRMKELWWYFSQSFEKGDEYFANLRRINDIIEFENYVTEIFETGIFKSF
jgi:tRNA-dihydrouridine synthase